MSKRYYISKIVGDGLTQATSYRPKIADYGVSWTGSIETDANGKPIHTHVLVMVATKNHSVIRNDVDIEELPDFPLDGKVNAIQTIAKTKMFSTLTAKGFNVTGLDNKDGYRDVLQAVGEQRQTGFNIDNFDVQE